MNNKEHLFFLSDFAKKSRFHWDYIANIKNLDQWEELSTNFKNYEERENSNKNDSPEKIPKIIHQIWLGPKKLPKKYSLWGETWRKFNPSWKYKLWTDNELKDFPLVNQELFDQASNYGFKSDIARYEILRKFGGIYVDTDFECLKPIPNDLLKYDFVSCIIFREFPIINNAMIMSKIKSSFIDQLINNINLKNELKVPQDTLKASGPVYLSNQYFSLSNNEKKKCLILPSNYFYPYPSFLLNNSKNVSDFILSYSIGIHHWEMSWMKGSILKRIFRKLLSLFKH